MPKTIAEDKAKAVIQKATAKALDTVESLAKTIAKSGVMTEEAALNAVADTADLWVQSKAK